MPANQVSKLILGLIRLFDRLPEPLEYEAGLMAEKIIQNIRFVFEI